jgi:IS5 family transposase
MTCHVAGFLQVSNPFFRIPVGWLWFGFMGTSGNSKKVKPLDEYSRQENGGGLISAMPTSKAPQAPGFFDVELRVQWLLTKGNPLSRREAVVDWERFRPLLDAALAKGPGGRPPHDRLKMFKTLVVQRFYNLSDEQTEYQVSDRLSFQRFIGWTLADQAPDANTIRAFREALIPADVFEQLFALFGQCLRERGLLAQPGKLVDASFVDVPRQRNPREENATIKGGATPAAWAEQPAQAQQKDVDARWTKKKAEVHYGDKNHVKADAQSKLIEQYAVTDARGHDSQMLAPLVATTDGRVYADSAYRSAAAEAMLAEKAVASQIHARAYRHRPLTEAQKESNRQKSKIRVRIEHIFGYLSQSMKGFYLRAIGRRRNAAAIGLINLIYNLARYEQIVRLKLLPLRAV